MMRNQRPLETLKERRTLFYSAVLGCICLACFVGSFLLAKKIVVVHDIAISGSHHLKAEDIVSLLHLRRGDELFSVSSAELKARVLKSPWVKDAAIRKDLAGRVSVRVVEAVPRALLEFQGHTYLIDRDGVLLEDLKSVPTHFLPVIRTIDPVHMKDAYSEALGFIETVHAKRGGFAGNGSVVVTGTRPEDITLHLDDVSIKIGAGDFERKLNDLQFVREEIAKRNIKVEYIDLRFANRIVVKPVNQDVATVGTDGKLGAHGQAKKH
ncbi:MAG TPA: FtsQ-type POTRA domain-containing protein [Dissulfurispiraceae bacterium]|nr:FtsQ-type POTRA domain-containing protein [Dissulfurispiraceae bacterium]